MILSSKSNEVYDEITKIANKRDDMATYIGKDKFECEEGELISIDDKNFDV